MDLAQRRLVDTVVVSPVGRIDQSNADAFQAALAPALTRCTADGDRLILDLTKLEYISSAGLRVFMLASKQAKAKGGTIVISGLQPLVAEIFQISRFTMIFTITSTLRDAVAKVSVQALAAFESA